MASTYTALGVELMATGENAGTWGTKTNTNLNIIEQISGGYIAQAVTDSGTPTALTVSDGSAGATMSHRMIELTGTISGARVVTIPLDAQTFYFLRNSTSGAYTVQFKYASGSGDTFTFSATDKGDQAVFATGNDGTNPDIYTLGFGDGDVTLTGTQTLTNKTLTAPKIGTSILDTSGNELFKLTATGSAVNELTYNNASTGNKPTFTASGGDTNIGVSILPKGSGQVTIDNLTFPAADGSANQILTTNGSGALSFVDNSGGTSWVAAVKTANFTAAAGEGYFVNTAGGAFEIDLPGSPSVGDEIEFVDFTRNFATAALTLDQGSLKFQGFASPKPVYSTDGQNIKIVYSGSTQGWIPIRDDDVTNETPQATITDFLVIAGGGGAGSDRGGGGGAGGYRNSFASEASGGGGSSETALSLNPGTTYTVTIGAGGVGESAAPHSTNSAVGANSSITGSDITDIVSIGGGRGGSTTAKDAGNGGSGGGAHRNGPGANSKGTGTSNQGFNGEDSDGADVGGGGGGAVEVGGTDGGGFGGDGLSSSITGSAVARGGGGAGHSGSVNPPLGGDGGGGNGGYDGTATGGSPGTANTGGGGGGRGNGSVAGGSGGSGVVILSMADADYSGTTSGSPTVATGVSGKTVLTFNGSGSYTA